LENYIWLSFSNLFLRYRTERSSTASVTHSSSHSSFLTIINAFLSFFFEQCLIWNVLLLSIENAHITVKRARQVKVEVLCGSEGPTRHSE
jgi:hypothetical protein